VLPVAAGWVPTPPHHDRRARTVVIYDHVIVDAVMDTVRRLSRALETLGVAMLLAVLETGRGLAQSPAPTPMRGVDPRGGSAATMSGDPVLAAVGVIALGIVAAAATVAWVTTVRSLRR
jgi:hypothetical protein